MKIFKSKAMVRFAQSAVCFGAALGCFFWSLTYYHPNSPRLDFQDLLGFLLLGLIFIGCLRFLQGLLAQAERWEP